LYISRVNLPLAHNLSNRASSQFWLLVAFIAVVFLTGGSSRFDVQSLVLLSPFAIVVCGIASSTLTRHHLRERGWLVTVMAAVMLVSALHVLPLPPEFWRNLPGRNLLSEIGKIAGLNEHWRPLALSPNGATNTLISLSTPLAVVLLGIQLNRDDIFRLLPVLMGFCVLSGLLGLFQVVGGPESLLYLYRVTNSGSAVGLFANRNHAALLLASMLPMLAVFASIRKGTKDQQRVRAMITLAAGIVLVPLILVTGSRAGLIVGLLGLISTIFLYRRPSQERAVQRGNPGMHLNKEMVIGGLAVICAGFITVFFSRAESLKRIFATSAADDNRSAFWVISVDMTKNYFPIGTGGGAFTDAYQNVEPKDLLNLNYINHVHNDWIEIVLTTGILGAVILLVGFLIFLHRTIQLWRRKDSDRRAVQFGRMGSVLIAMLALGSFADYPLRTPAMMSVWILAIFWFSLGNERSVRQSANAKSLRYRTNGI
jgi:O-antigen ligase